MSALTAERKKRKEAVNRNVTSQKKINELQTSCDQMQKQIHTMKKNFDYSPGFERRTFSCIHGSKKKTDRNWRGGKGGLPESNTRENSLQERINELVCANELVSMFFCCFN